MRTRFDGALRRGGCLALALGCVAGLVACSNSNGDGSQVVASVGGHEITETQVNTALERQNGIKPDQIEAARRRVISGLVEQELVLEKAHDLKIDRDQRVILNMEAMKREVVASAYVSRIAEGASKPSEEDVQAYYDDNPALFSQRRIYSFEELGITASPDQAKAMQAELAQMKSAADITNYLKSKQIPVKATQSTSAAENLPMQLLKRVASLKPGQGLIVSAPGGFHILLLVAAQDSPLTEDQARPTITAYLLTQNKRQAVEKELASLHAGAKVDYFGKYADMAASAASSAGGTAPAAGASQAAQAGAASAVLAANSK